jgi:molybdenum cofactor biosynthesis protein MoaC
LVSSLLNNLFVHSPSVINFCNYSTLTHVNQEGKASMVDVSSKSSTTRIALAQSKIKVSPTIMKALKENSIKKGDALSTARIAAIISAKKTSDLIPLCHQIPLSNVQVKFFFCEVSLKKRKRIFLNLNN